MTTVLYFNCLLEEIGAVLYLLWSRKRGKIVSRCTVKSTIQWNLCNPTPDFSDILWHPTPDFSDILWHPTKMYGPKVFLLTKIKSEYFDILYNLTHFLGPMLCRIRQVLTSYTIWHISLVPCCVGLDRFWHPIQSDTFPWSLVVSD